MKALWKGYLADRSERDLLLLTAALALMLSTMEVAFIYLAIFAGYLVLSVIVKQRLSIKGLRQKPEFDLLIVLVTLGAFFSSPMCSSASDRTGSRATWRGT